MQIVIRIVATFLCYLVKTSHGASRSNGATFLLPTLSIIHKGRVRDHTHVSCNKQGKNARRILGGDRCLFGKTFEMGSSERVQHNKLKLPTYLFARGGSDANANINTHAKNWPTSPSPAMAKSNWRRSNPSRSNHSKSTIMYLACLGVTLIWIVAGTLFYSKYNNWPLPQSFFYAVDAGMSIGFCTDVAETTIGSRAFTIVYIILGASCVGGALFLFIKDIMEGLVVVRNEQFELLLARHAIMRLDPRDNHETEEVNGPSGVSPSPSHKERLSYTQFRTLIEEWTGQSLDIDTFERLCRRFDPSYQGYIKSEAFLQRCHENINSLLCTTGPLCSDRWMVRKSAQTLQMMRQIWNGKHRIFAALFLWVTMGVVWGVKRQGWDIITATHFAISALATGGLTGPEVNEFGILPPEPAIFCGIFCLFGIPLFALTLGHFARYLVEEYVSAVEEKKVRESITKPLQVTEFEYAKHICTPEDPVIHLSDFIVLQLMRQNKVDSKLVELIKAQFEILDVDQTGVLQLEQATCTGLRNATNSSPIEDVVQGKFENDLVLDYCVRKGLREDLFILTVLLVFQLQKNGS